MAFECWFYVLLNIFHFVQDGISLAHGEKFAESAVILWNYLKERKALHNLVAIGVNCIHPQVWFTI